MTANQTQSIQTVLPELPLPTATDLPQYSLDPTNPLIWILVITALLGNTDEVINAVTKLIEAIASLKQSKDKKRDRKEQKD